MAADIFLKIKDIEGESLDDKHKNEIDILSWSWGASNSGSAHMGAGSGAGRANFQDISFTKYVDAASTKLVAAVAKGVHIGDSLLTVRKAGGDSPLEYLKISLTNVFVTSYSTGGSGGSELQTETISLNFQKFKIEYFKQDEKGAGKPSGQYGHDIAANKML